MTQMNGHSVTLREAYDSGIDPITVELNNQTAARGKNSKKTQGTMVYVHILSILSFCTTFQHHVSPLRPVNSS
jgi:hypothetical protein